MTAREPPDMQAIVRDLVRAGKAGLVLQDEIPTGTAIMLELNKLATLTKDQPQRAIATAQARAFLQRDAF